jgi:putative endonuclease
MGIHQQEIGRWGENLAADFLEKRRYSILERNYRTLSGEIDLVALQDFGKEMVLVFVEVKTRTSESFGYPEQAITRKKWDHLLRTINDFQDNHPQYEYDWRVDVIAVQRLSVDQSPDIKHFENVIFSNDPDY